jgi:hypothetical protein
MGGGGGGKFGWSKNNGEEGERVGTAKVGQGGGNMVGQ